jgi:hypothetical protein
MIVSEHAAALNAELSGNSATRILTHCEHFLRLRQKRETMRNALSPLGVEVEPLPLHPAKLFDFCSVYLEHLQGADAIRETRRQDQHNTRNPKVPLFPLQASRRCERRLRDIEKCRSGERYFTYRADR